MGCEVGFGALEESRCGFFAFVTEDLRIREPAVIVDGVMDVGVSAALFAAVPLSDRAAELAMSAAVGDSAELFDVDVDQIPGSGMLVAAGLGASYSKSGVLVEVAKQRHLVAAQDR
ncbi:hypothetical protein SRABI91_05437 [Rhodococcoides fascians]|nr:hypothetical protein SRABI91_05437 [Rhodococcus fascians]